MWIMSIIYNNYIIYIRRFVAFFAFCGVFCVAVDSYKAHTENEKIRPRI